MVGFSMGKLVGTCSLAALLAVTLGCGSDESQGTPGGSGGTGAAGAAGSAAGGSAGSTGGSGGAAGTAGTAGTAGAAGAAGTGGQPWAPRFDAFAEALQDGLAANEAYGVSAAVLENGEVTFAAAFGSKDADGNEPLTTTTLMQIGSTTKQMTAVALLRNVESAQVSLDDNLSSALPKLSFTVDPSWSDQILVRHLLSHQGALYDYTPWDTTANDNGLTSLAYGAFGQQEFLMAPPGQFWNYANPNFILAGLISQELDTRMWPDIMREDIFEPLGMNRTFLRKTEVEADGDYALSYGIGADSLENPTLGSVAMDQVPDPAFTRPAGLVWTTPTQMATWANFIMHGNTAVLSDALREQITQKHVDTLYLPGHMYYGFGMFVWDGYLTSNGTWYELPVWEHGGNTLSFTNLLFMLPDRDFAVIITSSGYGTDFTAAVDTAVTTLVDLPSPSLPPSFPVDPSTFGRHVGTYTDQYNVGDIIVTQQGDALFIDMPLLDSLGYVVAPELEARSSDIFLCTIDGAQHDLTFIPDPSSGESAYIRNRAFVGTRASVTKSVSPKPSADAVARWLQRSRSIAHAPGPMQLFR